MVVTTVIRLFTEKKKCNVYFSFIERERDQRHQGRHHPEAGASLGTRLAVD